MLYTHHKREFLIGMSWTDHADDSEARAFIRAQGKPHVMVDVDDPSAMACAAVGLQEGADRLTGRASSAALAVGLMQPNAIVCQTVGDSQVWFAILRAGVPMAGFDRLVSPGESEALLQEQMLHTETIVGDVTGAACTLAEALDQFEQQVAAGRFSRQQLAAIEVRRPTSHSRLALQATAGLAVMALLAAGGWTYSKHLASAKDRSAALQRITRSQQEQARLAAQRQQAIASFQAQVAARRAEMLLALQGPWEQWLAWEAVRRRLPLSVNGYVPHAMECSTSTCSISWKAAGPAVRFVDKAALPGWVEDAEPSFEARSELVVAPVTSTGQAALAADGQATRLDIAQRLQFAADGVSVGAPTPVRFTPPSTPPDTGLQPVDLGHSGEFRLAAGGDTAVVRLHEAMGLLRRSPIALKAIRWSRLETRAPAAELEGSWVHLHTPDGANK